MNIQSNTQHCHALYSCNEMRAMETWETNFTVFNVQRNQIGAVIPVFHRKLNWTCTSVCPYPTLILLCLLFAPPPLPRARLFLGFRKLER